jgi:hypothetical protein
MAVAIPGGTVMADDHALRLAAFREVHRLADLNGDLTSRDLRTGFHFSKRILQQKDGPSLDALKLRHEQRIRLPRRGKAARRLAIRFDTFKGRS